MKARWMEPFILVSAAIVVLAIGIAVQVMQPQSTESAASKIRGGNRPPITWKSQTDLSAAENHWGIFGAKGTLVTSNEILLFYTIHDTFPPAPGQVQIDATRGLPLISATACPQAGGTCFPVSVVENKALGSLPIPSDVPTSTTIKHYQLGVARLTWVDRPNHVIKVTAKRISAPIGSTSWTIEPLVQVGPKSNVRSLSHQFLEFRQGKPKQIALAVGSLGGTLSAAAVKLSAASSPNVAPVYAGVDLQHVVSILTPAEYVAYTTALPPEPAPFVPDLNAPPTATTPPKR